MDLKLIFLWLSLILFFISFNPYFPYINIVSLYMTFTAIISLSYIVLFFIYFFVKDYEKIKKYYSEFEYKATSRLIHKSNNLTIDLIKFSIISILIILFIDVILTKISEQSLFIYVIELIPGLQQLLEMINLKINDIFNPSTKPTTWDELQKFKNLKNMLIFLGPILGPLILFFLRQISYKKHSRNKLENPGGRILLLFLVLSSIILASDLYHEIDKDIISYDVSVPYISDNKTNEDKITNNTRSVDQNNDESDNIIRYTFFNLTQFVFYNLLLGSFYISIVSIWIFDHYIFSKLWQNNY